MEQQTNQFLAESTDPSQPAAAVRAALPIVVLSEDSTLLEAITNAAVEWCPVITSPSADRFIDQLVAAGSQLALIDAAASPPALADFLTDLHRQFPQLQILVAGPGTVQHQIAAQLSDGTVFRFAHKPASAQRLKLFVDAALRQRQARITAQIVSSAGSAGTSAAGLAAQTDRTGAGGRPMMLGAVIAALLVAVAGGVLWYSRHSPTSAPQADRAARQPDVVPADSTAEPAPAAVAPSDAPATGAAAVLAAQRAEEQEAIDRAAAERSERSEHDRLAAESQARASATEAEQLRRSAETRSNQIRQYVQLAQQRIASAALLEPAGDSARSYVAAAVAAAPDDQDVRAVASALGDALAESFRKALNAGDGVTAARWLKACRSYDLADAALNQMSVQLDALNAAQVAQSAATLMTSGIPGDTSVSADAPAAPVAPAAPIATATTAAPAPTTEAAAAAVASKSVAAEAGVIAESKLHRLRFTAPTYPAEALQNGQSGIVDLDFTVGVDGKVKDIKITAADPPGMFEQASVSALARNRYEPVQRNGEPVEQRAHLRMRFAL